MLPISLKSWTEVIHQSYSHPNVTQVKPDEFIITWLAQTEMTTIVNILKNDETVKRLTVTLILQMFTQGGIKALVAEHCVHLCMLTISTYRYPLLRYKSEGDLMKFNKLGLVVASASAVLENSAGCNLIPNLLIQEPPWWSAAQQQTAPDANTATKPQMLVLVTLTQQLYQNLMDKHNTSE